MIEYIYIFFLGVAIDLVYVWYIKSVLKKAKIKAGVLSVALAAPAMFGWFEVYEEKLLAIPYFLGLFCGTILALELGPRQGSPPLKGEEHLQ